MVAYMVNDDFDINGSLITKEIPSGIPVLIMIQSSWCHYCNVAKPAFQDFANKYKDQKKIFCATIQIDGYKEKKSEKTLANRLKNFIPNYNGGVPHYVLYVNKEPINRKEEGRSLKDLEQFCFPVN